MFKNINISLAVIICLIILYIFYNIFICENFAIQKRESDEVWGVNAANQILKAKLPCLDRNNNIKCDWKLVGDNLKQVSQSDGKVWAIDNDNNIKYCINTKQTPCSSDEDWKTIPISLKQISVGKDALWGIDNTDSNNIKYCSINNPDSFCEDKDKDWETVPGNFKNISIGKNNDVWVIDSDNNIKYCNNDKNSPCYNDITFWKSVARNNLNETGESEDSIILNQISTGEDDTWVIKNNGDTFKCNKPCNGNWIRVPGNFRQISVGKDAVWGVNDENIKYCINTVNYPCNDNKWVNINSNLPNKLTNVSVK